MIVDCVNCKMLECINWEYFNELSDEDYYDELYDYVPSCYCDKIGTNKIWWSNPSGCECYGCSIKKEKPHCYKKRNKREKYLAYKNKLKKNAKNHHGAYLCDKKYNFRKHEFTTLNKPYYKEIHRGQRSKYLKRISNKAIRRYKGDLPSKGNGCYKVFDFWWEYD